MENEDKEVQVPNNEEVATSIFDKLKGLFSLDDEKDQVMTKEEQDKLIEEKAQALANDKLKDIIPKAKKDKEDELINKINEIEKEQATTKLNKELELCDDNFKDFVKHIVESTDTSVEEYLKANPQYAKKIIPKGNQSSSNTSITLNNKQQAMLDLHSRSGRFN